MELDKPNPSHSPEERTLLWMLDILDYKIEAKQREVVRINAQLEELHTLRSSIQTRLEHERKQQ